MKVALVHDDLVQNGGAEKVLLALHELWPEAPVYTALASPEWRETASKLKITLVESFLGRFPKSDFIYKAFAPFLLYNLAFEQFDLSDFDLVLSSSSRFAHGVLTKPGTIHISYVHSPNRAIWDEPTYFKNESGLGKLAGLLFKIPFSYMRAWDYVAFRRPDYLLSNSYTTGDRLKRLFGRESTVLYPFPESPYASEPSVDGGYFVVLSRLVAWKRIDVAVNASIKAGKKLVVIGDGPELGSLKKNYPTVDFRGYVSEQEKHALLKNAIALVVPQEEDFGMTALESMALGVPVIGYKAGGLLETVIDGKTGTFFSPQTSDALAAVLSNFDRQHYDFTACVSRAKEFDKSLFLSKIKDYVNQIYVSKN